MADQLKAPDSLGARPEEEKKGDGSRALADAARLWEERRAKRDVDLCEAIVGRCLAVGCITLAGVPDALRECVCGDALIAVANRLIREGRLTEMDLIPLPDSKRPEGPNPYALHGAAAEVLACMEAKGEIETRFLDGLGEAVKAFDQEEARFRAELEKFEGKAVSA